MTNYYAFHLGSPTTLVTTLQPIDNQTLVYCFHKSQDYSSGSGNIDRYPSVAFGNQVSSKTFNIAYGLKRHYLDNDTRTSVIVLVYFKSVAVLQNRTLYVQESNSPTNLFPIVNFGISLTFGSNFNGKCIIGYSFLQLGVNDEIYF